MDISIHTPTQGVTWVITAPQDLDLFQSTLPRREWLDTTMIYCTVNKISIHTPTQGVTSPLYLMVQQNSDFNPHSHAGSDFNIVALSVDLCISIHTPTQGVTIVHSLCLDIDYWFQSTLPRREWRSCPWKLSFRILYFNPHSHAGSDSNSAISINSLANFNPHSHAGSDGGCYNVNCAETYFNPHSHAGSDKGGKGVTNKTWNFNPHSHAGSDSFCFRLSK